MSTYRLQSFRSRCHLDITEETYNEIRDAKAAVLEAIALEESFSMVLAGYYEYEVESPASAAFFMVYGPGDWEWQQEQRLLAARRLMNLLTACRHYLDQLPSRLDSIYGAESTQRAGAKATSSKLYDENVGYRIMEAIRNYAQHRGFPVHLMRYSTHRVPPEPGGEL